MSKFYITTSIAYTNAEPHIGFALELVQADVLARFHREAGDDVFFLTGTDDHGIKIQNSAKKAKISPEKYVGNKIILFKELAKQLNISNDDFISTSDKKKHWAGPIFMWNKLVEANAIYLKDYEAWYCEGCEAFVNPRDLVDGKCPNHAKAPELVKEKNYFFALSKYKNQIIDAILANKINIIPLERKNEMLNIIKEMEDVSFSRSVEKLQWGIPVVNDNKQMMYVWCDALTNYISALGYGTDKTKKLNKFWPADVHMIGKDILKFHAAIWPAMLLAAGLQLPKTLFVHGFITSEGQKMSKSLGNVVDPFEYIKKYGADAVRYYLLREIAPTGDGDFSIKRFEQVYNGELANELGNLVQRTIILLSKNKQDINPEISKKDVRFLHGTQVSGKRLRPTFFEISEQFKFNDFLKDIWKDIREANEYIEHSKPWELAKTNPAKLKKILTELVGRLDLIAYNLSPFLPETSEKIQKQLKTLKPEVLFPRIK